MKTIPERLDRLREVMQKHGVEACLIPSQDPHQSEYVASHWEARAWISGFTGSAGVVVVTAEKAVLWTDSRYTLQAAEQTKGSSFENQSLLEKGKLAYPDWICRELSTGSTLAVDGRLLSAGQYRRLHKKLNAANIRIETRLDLPGEIWDERPALPGDPVYQFDHQYTGESRGAKINRVRKHMEATGAQAYLVSRLDDIAWLLNLRGQDVPFNPVFLAYAVILPQETLLFIDARKIAPPLKEQLKADRITLMPYDDLPGFLQDLPGDQKVMVEDSASMLLHQALDADQRIQTRELIQEMKAVKNSTEIEHTRNVMIKDGVALCRFFRWLEEMQPSKALSEYDLARQLDRFRSEQEGYVGESFPAIVGFRENGAIVHYRPEEKSSALINQDGILLLDSGGQYREGTTDITRTIAIGTPTETQRQLFTLVLKGHIALDSIHFPEGTSGGQLDVLARMHLWNQGKNFGHGTGHGVGFFLNVHEGPQGFSSSNASPSSKTPLRPGMITSNEPGYYEPGAFGIRIENLILCQQSPIRQEGDFLCFETLSLYPLDLKLIQPELLTAEEADWINNYHRKVYDKLSPYLQEAERKWLAEKCVPVNG